MSKTVLYARTSTLDQTLDHQRAQAEAAGFVIDEVIADQGVSGTTTTLAQRPEGRRLDERLRAGDTLVVHWVDRLGRNYQDVTDTIRHFMRQGVVIKTVIGRMVFDGATKDPVQQAVRDALIAFMAASAQAQAEARKEVQRAGIAAAKAREPRKYRGRKPSYGAEEMTLVMDMLDKGAGASEIARVTGLTRQTVLRIKANPAYARRLLEIWGMADAA